MKNKFLSFIWLVLLLAVTNVDAQSSLNFCNPLNLSYRFQLTMPSRREAADPVVILFKGKYFLFASKSGGYWTSADLYKWNFITTNDLPLEDYAPGVVVVNDSVYFVARDNKLYSTADPLTGHWKIAKEPFNGGGDPDLFLDSNGKLYLYNGLSNKRPIMGVEIDRKTLTPIGKPTALISSNHENNGWERPGDYNTIERSPWFEGAWMNKVNDKYYLQYAVPGTQFKSYADGVYVSKSPLGPFRLCDNNPFSYKPEGFINGAGHSCTFQDVYGNYWHMATMSVSVKHSFERRLGLFPAFIDKDGEFYTYTGFGDFPHSLPQSKINSPDDYQPTDMLLSYQKPVTVSSSSDKRKKEFATDENIRTYWSAISGNKGEWISVDLLHSCMVKALQINFAEDGATILGRVDSIYYQYLVEGSLDGSRWETIIDKTANTTDVPHDYVLLAKPTMLRYIRLTNFHIPSGKFAISDLRVFGKSDGKLPNAVRDLTAKRDTDARNVKLKWEKVPNATGYNIRFGTKPNKLYLNYQVLGKDTLTIHSLNKLKPYYFSIDAFNETGVTKGKDIEKSK